MLVQRQKCLPIFLATAVLGTACGGSEEESGGLRVDPAFAGLYTQVSTVTLVNEFPGLPAFETRTRSYGYGAISVDDGTAWVQETPCKIMSDGGPVNVVIPDEFVRSIQVPRTKLEVREENGRRTYFLPERPVALGVKLQDPANEPLPTSASDPRIFDHDNDGKPGITVKIQGSQTEEIYVVRRVKYSYLLEEVEPGVLQGRMQDRSEQVTIGASTELLAVNPKTMVSENPTKTFVELRRAPAGLSTPDCSKIAVTP